MPFEEPTLPHINPEADWFFVNTDAVSLGGVSPHDRWIEHGMAFTGGSAPYGKLLGALSNGDVVLAWANGIGVVAVGVVVSSWDGVAHRDAIVYVEPYADVEYRVGVDWFLNLRSSPIGRREIGWNPVRAVQRIVKGIEEIRAQVLERAGTV